MGVHYDVVPSAVRQTLGQVDSLSETACSDGGLASEAGQSISGLCGTAVPVGDAFARLWAQRSRTGVRGGDYAAGCAAAVSQACAAIAEGDGQMQQEASVAEQRAASAARFGRHRV